MLAIVENFSNSNRELADVMEFLFSVLPKNITLEEVGTERMD